jgi:hypothetical protein
MRRAEGWAILIVIAVGAGFLVYAAAHAVGQVLALQTSGANGAAPATAVDTSGWTDYHNAQYNFDFDYPPTWQLSTSGLANTTPFVAVGDPLDGTSTYAVEIFIENTSSLSSGEFVHQIFATDRPHYQGAAILQVGASSYDAYELESVYEFDHNADQIYVADGTIVLRFDFPVAEENPNISLPVINNGLAYGIVNTLSFGR